MLAAAFLPNTDLFKLSQATSGLPSQSDSRPQGPSIRNGSQENTPLLAIEKKKKDSSATATRPGYKDPTKSQAGTCGKASYRSPIVGSTKISTNPQAPEGSRKLTDQAVGMSAKTEQKAVAVVKSDFAKQLVADLPVNDQQAAVAMLKGYVKQQADGAGSYDTLVNIAAINNDMARVDLLLSMRLHVLTRPFVNETRVLDSMMTRAAVKGHTLLLSKLLDAHPHAHRNLLDRSVGTFAFNFFRKIESWFGSDAVAWQRTQGIDLVRAAARTANRETMTHLLDRAVDLTEDGSEMEDALYFAMSAGNAESTAVLLKAVLHENPGFAGNMIPTTLAAINKRAGVLEVLVSNGMILPPKRNWSEYAPPIEDYLHLKAADQQMPEGKAPARPLSRIALNSLIERRSSLTPELRKSLNGKHEKLSKAQTACQHAGIFPDSGWAMTAVEPFIAAGFTAQTAAGLADQLNSNAEFDFNERGVRPLLNLAGEVGAAFEYFVVEGKVRVNLPEYLMEQGMYGLVADLVKAVIDSAAKSATWTMKQAEREMLLAEALIETLGKQQNIFKEASWASGDPALFATLLNSQLKILEAHQLRYFGQKHVA